MPASFSEIIKGMSTEDLKDLLEFNSNSKSTYLAYRIIEAELENREE